MIAVLRQHNFLFIWLGGIISQIGDWMLFVALPVYVYELTGSTLATGLTFIIEAVPRVLLGSVAGVFVDRWNLKRTMISADLLRALAVLPLLAVSSTHSLWVIYVVALATNIVSQFYGPAENAVLPQLVDESSLMDANAALTLGANLTRLVGPAAGGGLVTWLGFHSVVTIDSLSFALSAVCTAAVVLRHARSVDEGEEQMDGNIWTSVWREWWAGLQIVRGTPAIRSAFLVVATVMPAEGILQVLFVVFVTKVLKGGAGDFGLVLSAQAIGGVVGSLVIGRIGRLLSPGPMVGISGVVNGLILLIIFNFHSLALALALFVVAGLPVGAFFVSLQTALQKNVADEYLGRVFGAFGTTVALMTLIGMAFASAMGDRLGIVPTLDIVGVLNIAAGLVAFSLLRGVSEVPAPLIETIDASKPV